MIAGQMRYTGAYPADLEMPLATVPFTLIEADGQLYDVAALPGSFVVVYRIHAAG
jgi:hypothetical protein